MGKMMQRNKCKAFSLQELLTVIAVLAISLAVLVPVFMSAREKARRALCCSNGRTLAQAILNYAQDNDQTFPIALDGHPGTRTYWENTVMPYLNNKGALSCPDDQMGGKQDNSWWLGADTSWGVNAYYTRQNKNALHGAFGIIDTPRWAPLNIMGTVSRQTHPAQSIMAAEMWSSDIVNHQPGWFSKAGNATNSQIGVFSTDADSGAGNYHAIPEGNFKNNTHRPANVGAAYNPAAQNGGVSVHPIGYATFIFCDGHVQTMKPVDTNPNGAWDDAQNLWNVTR